MANNTIETVWVLKLKEDETRQSESIIQRLARLVKEKLGKESTAAIDQTTDALKRQNKQLKENEEQAKKTGEAGKKASLSDTAGSIGGAAGKLRGVGSLLGGGEALGLVNDIGDAVEAVTSLGGVLTGTLVPAASAALAALAPIAVPLAALVAALGALAVAVKVTVDGIQKDLERLSKGLDAEREAIEAAFSGATVSEAKEQIDEYNNSIAAQTEILTRNEGRVTAAFDELVKSKEQAFGFFGDLAARLQVFFGLSKVGEYQQEVDKSKTALEDATIAAREWQEELDAGSFKADEAAKAEEKLTDSRAQAVDAAGQAQKAEQDASREREKAAAEQQRAAEQQAQKEQQIDEKRYQAAQKYGDALVDIANKSADDAKAALTNMRAALADNDLSFRQDLADMTADFQAGEREEALARMEDEAADLRTHANKLAQIRDDAYTEESDLLKRRDFLGATRVREAANRQIEQENKTLIEASQEKLRLQKQEDAQQLREFDRVRRERFNQLQRANAEAKQQYQRDIENQREARRIAERDAGIARDRDLRAANEMARALLGIHSQLNAGIVNLGQNALNSLRGMGNTTNNNQRIVNGGINFNMQGISGQGIPPSMIRSTVLGVLGEVGLT